VRLGETEAADHFTLGHARQPLLFLLFAAEGIDGIHAQARLHGDEAAQARIAAFEFLADQAIGDAVEAGAAVAVEGAAEQAEFRYAGDQFTGKAFVFEAIADDGQDLVIDEAGDRVLHHLFVFAQHRADGVEIDGIEFGAREIVRGSLGQC
jgi:hypothetical protein